MSTQEKVAKVNELAAGGMKKMDALKKVGIPYGTYFSANKRAGEQARKYAKRIKKPYSFELPLNAGGGNTITLTIKDFAILLKEVSKNG